MDLTERMEQALTATAEDIDEGKQRTFGLDTGANPSYVKKAPIETTELTKPQQVRTPSGAFRTTKRKKINIRTKDKTVTRSMTNCNTKCLA